MTLAFDTPVALNRVYRAASGPHTLTFSGTIAGGDGDIDARILKVEDGAEMEAWATVATSAGGAWSFTRAFSGGPGRKVEIRKSGEPSSAAFWPSLVLVGTVWLIIGQSNGRNWWQTRGSDRPLARPATGKTLNLQRWSGYGWFDPTRTLTTSSLALGTFEPNALQTHTRVDGNGMGQFLLSMQDATDMPAAVLAYAIGGTAIETWLPGGFSFENMLATIDAPGGPGFDIDGVLIISGESNANAGTTAARYVAAQAGVIEAIRERAGNPALPAFVALLGRYNSTANDDMCDAIRQAQLAAIDVTPGVFPLHCPLDRQLIDTMHRDAESYEVDGARSVVNLLPHIGFSGPGAAGPQIVSGTAVGNLATFAVTTGATIAGTAPLSGLELQVNGTARAIVSAEVASNAIEIDFDGDPVSPGDKVGVRHLYGKCAALVNVAHEATALACPIQPTRGWFTIAA